ncbi:MAG: hypothetical protein KAI24_03940, partial [Planctomycetes bacterium]|nr:hypothetical protein [Planctomycetota bacterium]
PLQERVVPGTPHTALLANDGESIAVMDGRGPEPRQMAVVDVATGEARVAFEITGSVFHWNRAPGHPYSAVPFGDATRTDFYDLATGELLRTIRGPDGASQWYEAVDPQTRRALVVLGDLRVRSYDLDRDPPSHSGEYTRLVRANTYRCGFIANSELAWAMSANEVHVFHRVTCRPFCVIRLDQRAARVGARPDGSELLTLSQDGVFQRWPLEPAAAARRKVVGVLGRRQMELFDIGGEAEREERERLQLQLRPTPRGHAALGERALRGGDLDEAIRCYRESCGMGLLGRLDRHLYVRLFELICRRLARGDGDARAAADRDAAVQALEQCLRCGVAPERLAAVDGFDALRRLPKVRDLLGL